MKQASLIVLLSAGLALPLAAEGVTATAAPQALTTAAQAAAAPEAVSPAAAGVSATAAPQALSAAAKAEPETNKWEAIAAKAAAGNDKAFAEITKAIDAGDAEAHEALVAAQNRRLVNPLKDKALTGDLNSLKKLLDLRTKGNALADAALLSVYETLAPKAAKGDDIAGSVLEVAAKRGDKRVQPILDKASAKLAKPAADAEAATGTAKAAEAKPAAAKEAAPAAAQAEPKAADEAIQKPPVEDEAAAEKATPKDEKDLPPLDK